MTQTMSGATTTSRTKIRDAACSICVVASADDDDDAVADPAACSSSPVIILIGPQSYEWRKLECSGSGLCRDHGHDNMVMVTVAAVRHRRHGHGQRSAKSKGQSQSQRTTWTMDDVGFWIICYSYLWWNPSST